MERLRTDAVVVGGGPAGLATALALRRQGLTVAVLDRQSLPIDKSCGEGLLPAGVRALQLLGVPVGTDVHPLRGIRFEGHGRSVEATFGAGRFGLGIRRTELHRRMAAAAEQAGVHLFWTAKGASLTGEGVTADDITITADWVIAADGQRSGVRKTARLEAGSAHHTRYGFRQHFAIRPWTDFVEVHWSGNCQVYVTPVRSDEVGIAILTRNPDIRVDEALHYFPALRDRLKGARHKSSERGGLSVSRRLVDVTRGNLTLVGEASGSVDAVTGDGLSLAFQQALALAEAIRLGDLTSYEWQHRRIMRVPRIMSRLLVLLDGRTLLQQGTMQLLSWYPALFERLLRVHVGQGADCQQLDSRTVTPVEVSGPGQA